MFKLCISVAFLGAVFAISQQLYDGYEFSQTFNEIPCLSLGGICVSERECPRGKLAKLSGLCPEQQRRGVECCHSVPKSEKRCRRRGGECMPAKNRCPDILTYKEATDCQADETCCILVK